MTALLSFLAALPLLLSTPTSPASPGSMARGVWPLDPRPVVAMEFDPPGAPWMAGHRGVDLLGRVGEPVRVALPGTVTFAGSIAGRGVVVVDHGARRTTYEPVSATVTVGQSLPAGAMLGRLEVVGSHCFPAACLHWGLIGAGSAGDGGPEEYLDPLSLVGPRPVVLLPLRGHRSPRS